MQSYLCGFCPKAAEWLNEHEGAALLTTGSKELAAFTRVKDYEKRLYARVLSCRRWQRSVQNWDSPGNI